MQLDNNIRITALQDIIATLQNRFDILESENQKLKSSVGELIAPSSKTNTPCWSYQTPITVMYLVAVLRLVTVQNLFTALVFLLRIQLCCMIHELRQSLLDAAPHFPKERVRACARTCVCVCVLLCIWMDEVS